MESSIAFFLLAMAGLAATVYGDDQSVRVQGYLRCEGKPYADARVKLFDKDTFTPDDKLAETKTDSRGYFDIQGVGHEVTRLNAKFNLYHRCGMTVPVCYYKNSFKIPFDYVTSGQNPDKIYDAGTIELSLLKKDRDCINKFNRK